jgi:hypothetical protein
VLNLLLCVAVSFATEAPEAVKKEIDALGAPLDEEEL